MYLLLPSLSSSRSSLFSFLLSSRFIALRRRCVSREILGRREYETTTGRHCAGDRRTDNRNDSPAHLYLNDSQRVFPRTGGGRSVKTRGARSLNKRMNSLPLLFSFFHHFYYFPFHRKIKDFGRCIDGSITFSFIPFQSSTRSYASITIIGMDDLC